jgi:ribosome-associated toxin RatA of RatAB toxin-antitoxin module
MHRSNEIQIDGDVDTIFRLGSQIECWPALLPHYRSVDILWQEGNRYVARMRASRNGIPVSWVCQQERDPATPRIYFRHVGGFTKGMRVTWIFEERANGVAVCITHDFDKGWQPAMLDRFVSDRVVGQFFVSNIANKTLSMVKLLAESEHASEEQAADIDAARVETWP